VSNKNPALTTTLGNWKLSYPVCRVCTAPTDLPSHARQRDVQRFTMKNFADQACKIKSNVYRFWNHTV